MITLDDIKNKQEISCLIKAANKNLGTIGYTEHGIRHVSYVSKTTENILREIGCDERTAELGAIAGYLHDIGNSISRVNHGHSGALIAFSLLSKMKMSMEEIITICGAIGNHEEEIGDPINQISSALIIADKSDAHRTRVRKNGSINDIHDRVNLSIKKNVVTVDKDNKVIKLMLIMDNKSAPMEYMQIYMSRMLLSERAAEFLGYIFELVINGVVINHHNFSKEFKLDKNDKIVSNENDNNII